MAKQKSVTIFLGMDVSDFRSKIGNVEKKLGRFQKSVSRAGMNLTKSLTAPIAGFGAVAVKNFDKQQKAIAQVEAGIRSTGGAAGFTSEQFQKMASNLQANTIFGDEEILQGATAQLLTFTNIAGEQFERTQQVALDLATRLDGDLKSSSIMLGKALNDPVANLSALSRAGIQFSEDQKAMVKQLVETNRLADAQTLILNELENQYGGSAQAAAQAGLGPIQQLKNSFMDVTEEIGGMLIPHLQALATFLKDTAEKFRTLDEDQKKNIVTFALVAASLGPVLLIISKMIGMTKGLMGATKMLANPYVAIAGLVATAAFLIIKNWDKVKVFMQNVGITLQNAAILIGNVWVDMKVRVVEAAIAIMDLMSKVEGVWGGEKFGKIKANMVAYKDGLAAQKKELVPYVKIQQKVNKEVGDMGDAANHSTTAMIKTKNELGEISVMIGSVRHTAKKGFSGIINDLRQQVNEQKLVNKGLDSMGEKYNVQDQANDMFKSFNSTLAKNKDAIQEYATAFNVSYEDAFLSILNMSKDTIFGKDGFALAKDNIEELSKTEKFNANWEKAMDEFGKKIKKGFDIASGVMNQLGSVFDAFANKRNTQLDNLESRQQRDLENEFSRRQQDLDNMTLTEEQRTAMQEQLDSDREAAEEKLTASLERKRAKAQKKQAKREKMMAIFQATLSAGNAVLSALSTKPFMPLGLAMMSVAMGLAGAQIAAIASTPLPALAGGGLATAPTLAMVGDNPNAAMDPEVIAPLSKLSGMMGGQTVNVVGRVSGSDLLIVNDRASQNRERVRGF